MRTNQKNKRETAQSDALDKTAKIISIQVPGGADVYELNLWLLQGGAG